MNRYFTLFLALILVLLAAGAIMAQAPAIVHWSLNATDSARVSAVSGNARGLTQTHGDSFMCRDYANGPGPDQRWYPYNFITKKAIMWGPDTTQNNNIWVQFAAHPKAYNDFHADSMTIYLGAKGTDRLRANLWYDTHADFSSPVALNSTPLVLKKDGDSLFTFILDKEVPEGDTLYVRVYAWNAGPASNSKYLYMRLCTIYGTTVANPIPASATWALTNPGTGGTGQTVATAGNVLAADEKLVNMNINGYTGYNSAQRLRIISAPGKYEWPAAQLTQIDSVYVEFSVSPKLGTRFTVNTLSMDLGCHSINNFKANVWYSKDPSFANPVQIVFQTADTVNNYLPRGPDVPAYTVTAQPGLLVEQGETFYLRVYPWVHNNATVSSGKYLTIQNVLIGGVSESAPMPSSATWALTDPNTGGTGKTVTTAGKVTAADEKLVNLNINQYTGYHAAQRLRIISAPGKYEWPAGQLTQIDSVYVEFAVSPKAGASFTVQSLSLDLGCHSINNFKANVWYSIDPSFANPVQVVFQTADTVNNYLPRGPDVPAYTVTAQPGLLVKPEETFYLRVYPWVHNNATVSSGKYLTIQNVVISGLAEGGADYEMPLIVTSQPTYISTTFATAGGTIPSDGGAPVTARGVCWSTLPAPTTADAKTVDGAGSGAFVSHVTGLTAGVNYHLRAYATNDAGTAYGEEMTFKTLDSLVVPTVTTVAVNNIMVKSAKSGGTVTEWGGSDVIARGICWNLTGDPTVADNKTENGTGIGAFTSSLSALTASTTYFVRAWATNATGTGYGQVETFTTQAPAPAVLKVVAQDGSGDYTTVQAAFNDVPDFYTGMWCIYVKAGTYREKLMLAQNKTNVVLKGENAMTTILTYDDYSGKAGVGGTSNSYSTAIEADDFTAMDITFQNTVKNDGTFSDQQAVALRINGDRGAYYNCRLLG
ncbi:MAG TPA: pectinesterase family protein, partial [bacterium]|nr:pectinesterase family protein [bacterium]